LREGHGTDQKDELLLKTGSRGALQNVPSFCAERVFPNSSVGVLTSRTSECGRIWRPGLYRNNEVKMRSLGPDASSSCL
jgi:hypothetical protein